MRSAWYVFFVVLIVFVFLYAWYLPANNTKQLILDLPANGVSKSIAVTNDTKIDQEITLEQSANSIELPVYIGQPSESGIIHLTVLKDSKVITQQDQYISSDVIFALPGSGISGDITLEFVFSGIEKTRDIALATAFGKYANLSGTVTQYALQGSQWKVLDTRHGNIALTLYHDPQKNHVLAMLKSSVVPIIGIIVLIILCAKNL
ncbi:MAG: hypothetical protein K8Q97_00265 [Candidatus Andersenbacteria bacterium]|nr:hypothetical protein [Candidatus Andersenbacteria bacterium]